MLGHIQSCPGPVGRRLETSECTEPDGENPSTVRILLSTECPQASVR